MFIPVNGVKDSAGSIFSVVRLFSFTIFSLSGTSLGFDMFSGHLSLTFPFRV